MTELNWGSIDTVLLDMDGTLLDLHFDDFFWLTHVPQKLAEREGISFDAAKQYVVEECDKVAGTLAWYCLDIWAEKLDMDLVSAKREIEHLISLRPDAIEFIDRVKAAGKTVVLVTNAHPDSLSLKLEHTKLDQHIDTLISTHEFGVTKESQLLWQKLQTRLGFNKERVLFVDDSLTILRAAKTYGIGQLLAVTNPSSQRPLNNSEEFLGTTDLRTVLP